MPNNDGKNAGQDIEPCSQCGSLIPSDKGVCPACGFNPRAYARWTSGIGILLAGVIIRFLPAHMLIAQTILLVSLLLIPTSLFITATSGSDPTEMGG